MSTQHSSTEKSIRAHVSVIRYEFEMDGVREFVWITGKENLANPGTKRDSRAQTPFVYFCSLGDCLCRKRLRSVVPLIGLLAKWISRGVNMKFDVF